MTREEKMQAVVEAARTWAKSGRPIPPMLDYALAALDAPDTAAETVTLAVWRGANGEVALDIAGSDDDVAYNTTWTRLGTVTLTLDREGGR